MRHLEMSLFIGWEVEINLCTESFQSLRRIM